MKRAGFTLVEMLVALAVFAVVAVVVQGNIGGVGRSLARLEERVFATWIAQNQIAEIIIKAERGAGVETSSWSKLTYGGKQWDVNAKMQSTDIRHLREVVVEVCLDGQDCLEPIKRLIVVESI